MKKVLLHICCGVCAIHSIQNLKDRGLYVEGFFFNPNIHPEKEYLKRKKAAERVSKIENIEISYGEYSTYLWQKECSEFAKEKEGQNRCGACYQLRLKKTHEYMKNKGFDFFTTTLTISPHKNSAAIGQIGQKIGKESFLPVDFKKQDGFLKTNALAKKYELYRQKYCGCIYSMTKK